MPAAGDDLRGYLILPPASSSPSSNPLSNLSPESRPDTPRFHKSANRKAEHNDMEVDCPAQPNTLTPADSDDAGVTVPLKGVMSLDDFLSIHPTEHGAHVATQEAAKAPPAKKSKPNYSTTSPQPVAVGARSSKYTILLNERHQALAIPRPVFTFDGDTVNGWTVEVSFPGLPNAEELQGLKEDGWFSSKQEAKEAASKTALTILERLVNEGRVVNAGRAKRAKGEPALQQQSNEREELGENFVGQLLEFQRATSGPQSTYTDYQLGTRWACLLEMEGYDQPFSSLDALFGSKKAAHQHAAGCVVAHFKAQGLWPSEYTEVGGIKKRKSVANAPSSPADGPKASIASPSTTSAASASASASATSQVAALAHLLSLNSPEYRFVNETPSVPDLHTVSCYFRNSGAHEGPIGEVRNVFGKKKAKEECARLVLQYLSELQRQREETAARLIAGISGGAGVAGVGVGMSTDRVRVAEKAKKEGNGSDEEVDVYEDAYEDARE